MNSNKPNGKSARLRAEEYHRGRQNKPSRFDKRFANDKCLGGDDSSNNSTERMYD